METESFVGVEVNYFFW